MSTLPVPPPNEGIPSLSLSWVPLSLGWGLREVVKSPVHSRLSSVRSKVAAGPRSGLFLRNPGPSGNKESGKFCKEFTLDGLLTEVSLGRPRSIRPPSVFPNGPIEGRAVQGVGRVW